MQSYSLICKIVHCYMIDGWLYEQQQYKVTGYMEIALLAWLTSDGTHSWCHVWDFTYFPLCRTQLFNCWEGEIYSRVFILSIRSCLKWTCWFIQLFQFTLSWCPNSLTFIYFQPILEAFSPDLLTLSQASHAFSFRSAYPWFMVTHSKRIRLHVNWHYVSISC